MPDEKRLDSRVEVPSRGPPARFAARDYTQDVPADGVHQRDGLSGRLLGSGR